MSTALVTVDVVDLRRIERLFTDFGPSLERKLLHPVERDEMAATHGFGKVRRLGGALAAKEAWIKSRSGRPAGWTFDVAAFRPSTAEPPVLVRELIAGFVDDLGVTSVEAGLLTSDPEPADGACWAWHGLSDHWLISAMLT